MSTSGKNGGCGFVYDDVMTKHTDPRDCNHVENPRRITFVYESLRDTKCLDKLVWVPARKATDNELCLVHTKKYIDDVKGYRSSVPIVCEIPEFYPTYVCDDTYEAAAVAVGGCLNLVDAVLTNRVKNGFALVRPPGHHAEKDKNQGFCFFNNIAIAARYIQSKYRHLVKKILIFDWDVHHGNGTQQEFYENDDVMFISIHRFDQAKFYPSLRESGVTSVGKGIGEGFNINIPWNGDKMGNAEYLAAFNQIVVPVAKAFQADILLVSAGFDAAEGDLLGEYHLTPDVYSHMVRDLKELYNGRIILFLEGGYNIEVMAQCVEACIQALLDDRPQSEVQRRADIAENVSADGKNTLNEVKTEHMQYWPFL